VRKLIRVEEISDGTLDTILVHPREVFKSAIAARAAAVVLVHNLCVAAHKLCYVERRFMWSRWAQAFIARGFFVVLLVDPSRHDLTVCRRKLAMDCQPHALNLPKVFGFEHLMNKLDPNGSLEMEPAHHANEQGSRSNLGFHPLCRDEDILCRI
jgi:hypothetical protein